MKETNMSDLALQGGSDPVHPVDEKLPGGRLAALGMQHVLVMYAGAVAVPLIVGRALKLSPEQVALLISADLFCCGLVTLIQSLGFSRYFGIKLPVMMGVTFAAVGPMVAMANAQSGPDGRARHLRRDHRRGHHVSMLHRADHEPAAALLPAGGHRHHHRHHRHQPDARGRGLGAGWPGPLAQSVDVPKLVQMVDGAKARPRPLAAAPGVAAPAIKLAGPIPMVNNANYGALDNLAVAGLRAGGRPAAGALRQGLRLQHRGAAGHHLRLCRRRGDGQDGLRQGRQGALVRRRHALCLRHADLRRRDDPDDDAGDDRGDDRIHWHVPGARRT
jgi:hypothetical protein